MAANDKADAQKDKITGKVKEGAGKLTGDERTLEPLDDLLDQAVPPSIRDDKPLALDDAVSEPDAIALLRSLADRNEVLTSLAVAIGAPLTSVGIRHERLRGARRQAAGSFSSGTHQPCTWPTMRVGMRTVATGPSSTRSASRITRSARLPSAAQVPTAIR